MFDKTKQFGFIGYSNSLFIDARCFLIYLAGKVLQPPGVVFNAGSD